jgi:hypothetical protein
MAEPPAASPAVVPRIEDAARAYAAEDYAEAERIGRAIVAHDPRHFDALHLVGVLLTRQQRLDEALDYLRRAELVWPLNPQLRHNIGGALLGLQRYADAEAALRAVLALQPGHVDALIDLGAALAGAERYAEADQSLRQAVAIQPNAPRPLYQLGRVLAARDRHDEAAQCFRAALAVAGPEVPVDRQLDLHIALVEALVQLHRYEDALAACGNAPPAIATAPRMMWNDSLTRLMLGDFAEGWRKYECRFDVPDHDRRRDGAVVLDPAKVAGQRVLVVPEQGHGDMIQFARYLPLLARRGARVTVEIYPELQPLFRAIEGVEHVVTPDDVPPPHDLVTPLLSLPLAFGTQLSSIPAEVPYLHVPPEAAARWAARLGPRGVPRIGVAWWGAQHIPKRSMPLATLAPLLRQPDTGFHALQKEIPPADQAWLEQSGWLRNHSAELTDYAETAALIAQMDLVISIDTSVAHLAGALGVPVWIMLPFSADWRWLVGREASPWYPTARLFRQKQPGAWDDVVRRVVDATTTSPATRERSARSAG